jgi:L-seryl-tRNA(Ser) seleniumtransferase
VEALLQGLRAAIAEGSIATGSELQAELEGVAAQTERVLADRFGRPLQRVLNATGVFVHTNLGRAPLPSEVASALPPLLDAYCDLEMDLESGKRGDRNSAVEGLICGLTGAPAALVVNNNAAALILGLAVLAGGRQALVSRGELVEIGGSFRIPAILEAAGVALCEVGSTNRTRLGDYEAALGPEAGVLLKVFPSNYRITGFTEAVPAASLAALGRRRGVPVLVDEGSGLLRPHEAPQLRDHESLSELVAAGCDLACGSGDKLLGGPQAGLLVGTTEAIDACRRHALYRALRPDRACLAALALVLRRHLAGGEMPLDRLWPDELQHGSRVAALAAAVGGEVATVHGYIGGGSAPQAGIEGTAVVLPADNELLARLRRADPPVVAYQKDDRLVLDLRTVDPCDDEALRAAVLRAQEGV